MSLFTGKSSAVPYFYFNCLTGHESYPECNNILKRRSGPGQCEKCIDITFVTIWRCRNKIKSAENWFLSSARLTVRAVKQKQMVLWWNSRDPEWNVEEDALKLAGPCDSVAERKLCISTDCVSGRHIYTCSVKTDFRRSVILKENK